MLEDKIKKVGKTSICVALNTKYTNIIQMTGFILQKPRVINGRNKSCSFIVHQITNNIEGTFDKSFCLITFVPELVEYLSKIDKVSVIHCAGVLAFNKVKKSLYAHITDLKISYQLDMELEPTNEITNK